MTHSSNLLRSGLILAACVGVGVTAACGPARGDPQAGRQLYLQQSIGESGAPGCVTCHSLEPERVLVGPSHARVAARARAVIRSQEYTGEATTPAEYLRESILDPDAYVVPGFDPNLMYEDYAEVLTERQLADLVAFLLTLDEVP